MVNIVQNFNLTLVTTSALQLFAFCSAVCRDISQRYMGDWIHHLTMEWVAVACGILTHASVCPPQMPAIAGRISAHKPHRQAFSSNYGALEFEMITSQDGAPELGCSLWRCHITQLQLQRSGEAGNGCWCINDRRNGSSLSETPSVYIRGFWTLGARVWQQSQI